jgi:hypothetical protein
VNEPRALLERLFKAATAVGIQVPVVGKSTPALEKRTPRRHSVASSHHWYQRPRHTAAPGRSATAKHDSRDGLGRITSRFARQSPARHQLRSQIPDAAFELGVAEQELNAQIPRPRNLLSIAGVLCHANRRALNDPLPTSRGAVSGHLKPMQAAARLEAEERHKHSSAWDRLEMAGGTNEPYRPGRSST